MLAQKLVDEGRSFLKNPRADKLKKLFTELYGKSFHIISGKAIDDDGKQTSIFDILITEGEQNIEQTEPVDIPANSLAGIIDFIAVLDTEQLGQAHAKITQAKSLKKERHNASEGPEINESTFCAIVAAASNTSLEELATELDRLNRTVESHLWPDIVVVLNQGIINYAVQFYGDRKLQGDFIIPAQRFTDYIPPFYIHVTVRPLLDFTINKLCALISGHLATFLPTADLPDWKQINADIPKSGLTLCGYQFDLKGRLQSVPRNQYRDRIMPQLPLCIADQKGEIEATIKFIPWQDGGVIALEGKLPLEMMLIFCDGITPTQTRVVRNANVQVSHVLPITAVHFGRMLQRFTKQSNMTIQNHPAKPVLQKISDEGSASPYTARLFMGILHLRDQISTNAAEVQAFDNIYDLINTGLFNLRDTARDIETLVNEHISRISERSIVHMDGRSFKITESIDRKLSREIKSFFSESVRIVKTSMQHLTSHLGKDIGFLFKKQNSFEAGVAALRTNDPLLADYLENVRHYWSERLIVGARNESEHTNWQPPIVQYDLKEGNIVAIEPMVLNQPIVEFTQYMLDRVLCFVEEITAHCIQCNMPQGLSIREVPIALRTSQEPLRFMATATPGQNDIWRLQYAQSAFIEK